jgi:hypothetical protein
MRAVNYQNLDGMIPSGSCVTQQQFGNNPIHLSDTPTTRPDERRRADEASGTGGFTRPHQLRRGREAYWHMHLPEAADDFEKAVATDLRSVQPHWCFGVACLFLYQNGVSEAQPRFFDPDNDRARGV